VLLVPVGILFLEGAIGAGDCLEEDMIAHEVSYAGSLAAGVR
jgi:hypothetical protein